MTDAADGLLDALDALAPLAPAERDALRATVSVRRVARGEAVHREGERCGVVWYVHAGVLRTHVTPGGDDRTLHFAPEGEMVTDYESLLTGAPGRLGIEAVEASTLAVLPGAAIAWAYETLPQGDRIGRRVAEALFLASHRRLRSFYLDTAEARYLHFVETYPGLVQRVPQHLIASYVGVRAPSLSRIRRRLAGRGSSPG